MAGETTKREMTADIWTMDALCDGGRAVSDTINADFDTETDESDTAVLLDAVCTQWEEVRASAVAIAETGVLHDEQARQSLRSGLRVFVALARLARHLREQHGRGERILAALEQQLDCSPMGDWLYAAVGPERASPQSGVGTLPTA
ncbi:MAG: hypothetical protein GF418_15990 [Chitinivibrionales bacterium]|nr:hypothetical protein [Chitinivibrionales bacterium]